MDKDLQKAIERLKWIKEHIKEGKKFFGKVTFHVQSGIIGHTTVEQVHKDG